MTDYQSTLIQVPSFEEVPLKCLIRTTGGDAGNPKNILGTLKNGDNYWLRAGGSVIMTISSNNPQKVPLRKVHFKVEDKLYRPSTEDIYGVTRDARPPLTFLTWLDYNPQERSYAEVGQPFETVYEGNAYPLRVKNSALGNVLYCILARGIAADNLIEQQRLIINTSNNH